MYDKINKIKYFVLMLIDFKQKNIILTNNAEGSNFVMANFVNVVTFNKASLQALKNINEQLVILKLTNLAIDDNDLKIVADLKNIKKLNLENSLITDDGMAYIKQLSQLEQLNLYGTNISDEGLIQLTSLKNLSQIYLWKTKVTKGGIEQFKKIHPKVGTYFMGKVLLAFFLLPNPNPCFGVMPCNMMSVIINFYFNFNLIYRIHLLKLINYSLIFTS